MSQQRDLTFTWHEAIDADIKALGGRKQVAARLWPADEDDTISNRIKACLAPGHQQQFKPLEVLKIKQWAKEEQNSTVLVDFEASVLSQRIEWIEPEDELERIELENNQLFKEILRRQEQIENLRKRKDIRSVK